MRPDDRLPPVRQLAEDLGLAVGTTARAYRELEAAHLVRSRRGGGNRVMVPVAVSPRLRRHHLIRKRARAYVQEASYCVKGRRVYIEGRLRTREYDGTDGLRRHSTEIVAETMKLLDRPQADNAARGEGDDAAGGGGDDAPGGGGAPGAGDNAGDHDESAESDQTSPRRRRLAVAAS